MKIIICLLLLAILAVASADVSSLRGRSLTRTLRQLPPYPLDRFQVWSRLTAEQQKTFADVLGYTEDSWNLPGQNELERFSFESITNMSSFGEYVAVGKSTTGLRTQIDVIKKDVNITEELVWDCHINHFSDYNWSELIEAALVTYVEDLGWTNDTWEHNGPSPDSENKYWYELNDKEKAAAEALCYFPDLWAGDVQIGDWVYQPKEINVTGSTDEENVKVEEHPEIEYWDLPTVPLTVWGDLTTEQKGNATILGYNETTWNRPGIAPVNTSYLRWGALTAANRSAAEALDLDEFWWDCLIQHYDNYQWSELKAKGVKHYFEALNWNYPSWHGITKPPSSNNQTYVQLGTGQKLAAKQLCFLPETYTPGGGDLTLINLKSPAFARPGNAPPPDDRDFP